MKESGVMKFRIALLFALILSLLDANAVLAQTEELTLTFSRDFGYSSGTGDIQGTFSMKVSGPAYLSRVEFYIDDAKIGEDSESPFRLQFTTDNYPLGLHEMFAIGYTADGREYRSKVVTANFVSADEGWQAAGKIAIPLITVVFGAILLSVVIPMLIGRGKREELPLGAERKYGMRGGGICAKCKRPFALPLFSMNLGFSKLARCPYCGKWSVVRALSLVKLRQAEQAELDQAEGQVPEISEEEKLKKELDDSKYQGM
jgi:DNA-directed RNA polymerase subunit RPC12/RpoP